MLLGNGFMRLQTSPDHMDVLFILGVQVLSYQYLDVREDHFILVEGLIALVLHKLNMLVQDLVHLFF